jgi:signal transduction histidine kinase
VIEVRNNPVPGGGAVLIYSDVTERKKAEAAIRRARDAAEAALDKLTAGTGQPVQSEKMASLGQLTAGIAHEIKNPLNFVNNFAGLSVELLDELKEARARRSRRWTETSGPSSTRPCSCWSATSRRSPSTASGPTASSRAC